MRRLWYHQATASVRGLHLAREADTLLLWDADHRLTWLTSVGLVQARWQASFPLAAADCSDDGKAAVALGTQGQVWFFDSDLKPLWQRNLTDKGTAVTLSPFGEWLAVADGAGTIQFCDNEGSMHAKALGVRPFLYLVFLPERPLLIGSADFGAVAAFDLSGKRLWHDSPVTHCGALATTGDGALIALASFSDGLTLYNRQGQKLTPGPHPGPCRLAALSYDGAVLLTTGLDGVVRWHERDGTVRSEFQPDAPVTSLAVAALGTAAYIGQSDGMVLALTAV